MPTISFGQVAIYYATASKILISKHVWEPEDRPTDLTAPVNQSILIVDAFDSKQLATIAGTTRGTAARAAAYAAAVIVPYDDASCRQLIAAATGTAVLSPDADRCCVVGPTALCTAVHKRDPVVLPLQPGETSLHLHPAADVGDTWNGTVFRRRWVIANKTTGAVLSVVLADVGQVVGATALQFAVPSNTANVGDVLPVPKA